ncbi:MAG: type II toxin-antitoxin system PemK/MazF family toxin [Ilumatobacter sp.]|nr:type II toxin-antitoxin system PemK/MazF family toxin [Ilumatobacter sp.]
MARDIGGFFDELTKRARGGRRLEGSETKRSRSSGSLRDSLQDLLRSGRSSAERVRETTRARRSKRDERRAPALPPEGVVSIEYSPRLDGDPDPGEVVWAWVPYEDDPDQGKDRPVVVIGRRDGKLVGVPLTTRRNDREAQIAIGTGDWDSQRRPSFARIWRMLDIDPGTARREGAVLERSRFDDVIVAVDRYYDVRR